MKRARSADALLEAGQGALARAAWQEARESFEAALAERESVEALLGLGIAARTQHDAAATLDAHERGYLLARQLGDDRVAARLALELALDCLTFRGPAEARGWLERAGRLLQDLPPGYEHGLLVYLRARFALAVDHDPDAAQAFAAQGAQLARAGRSVDGELVCVALEGLALVAAGSVEDGMRQLDHAAAAAVAGEISNPQIVEVVCCHLIDACQRVRDFDRAGEWCRRVEEIAERFGDASMFAACRTLYGEVLLWQGEWREAEETLAAVCRELAAAHVKAADGLVRLAELRRRQGRVADATALLSECGDHRLAPVVKAELALDRRDARAAVAEAERYLRRVGEHDRFERVPALELLVRARLLVADADAAERAATELEEIAASVRTKPLQAAALLARGRVEAARDPAQAYAALEDAVDLYRESGVRYEAAQAGLELAALLSSMGRDEASSQAEQGARAELAELGVALPEPLPRAPGSDALTKRERDVIRLLAQGHSNDEIAAELFLSVRTVESHVASLYAKIGVSGRTARAAATAFALAHGLA